jgi:hypothetical protein
MKAAIASRTRGSADGVAAVRTEAASPAAADW